MILEPRSITEIRETMAAISQYHLFTSCANSMILQVLLACIITSLVTAQEFEGTLPPDVITFRDENYTKGLFENQIYVENEASTSESKSLVYSEADELRGYSERELTAANHTSLTINDKTVDNGTDDAMLRKVNRSTDKEMASMDERQLPGTNKQETLIENVSLTPQSIDGITTVLSRESAISVSKKWTEETTRTESIGLGDPGEGRGTRDSSTAISQVSRVSTIEGKTSSVNEGHDGPDVDAQETTEFSNTSDDFNVMEELEAAAFKLYVGAAVVFAVCLVVSLVVGLTLWRRRRRALTREKDLMRFSQRTQIPQLEKLYSMAAFAAATDSAGADASRTLTRTGTVGRRPPGPRPVVTAASIPLLRNSSSSTEDLAQIRKQMFGDVRTWAPERRLSNPPTRNFFK